MLLLALAVGLPSLASAQEGDRGPRDGPPRGGEEEGGGPQIRDDDAEAFEVIESPFDALEVACIEDANAVACWEAGLSWHDGVGLEHPNVTQAANLWLAGCSFGDVRSCKEAGRLYLEGKAGVRLVAGSYKVVIDIEEAERLIRRACFMGDRLSCGIDGDIHMAPKQMVPEDALILDFQGDQYSGRQAFEEGCPLPGGDEFVAATALDLRSCTRLGQMYQSGHGGVRRDQQLALRYWDRGCEASGGAGDACDSATLLRTNPGAVRDDTENPDSVQFRRDHPDSARFTDPSIGVNVTAGPGRHYYRFDLELGVGARWIYGPSVIGGLKLRAGAAMWFNVVGISLETAFSTDKFVAVSRRLFARFLHSLGVKFLVPLRIRLPHRAKLMIGWGAGGTIGSVKFPPSTYVLAGGFREHVQIMLTTNQQIGPRQWGALRFEQQQTWHVGGGPTPEHSSQVVLIAGFTFGGKGPDWTPNKHDQRFQEMLPPELGGSAADQ